jgi:hypothetical protein
VPATREGDGSTDDDCKSSSGESVVTDVCWGAKQQHKTAANARNRWQKRVAYTIIIGHGNDKRFRRHDVANKQQQQMHLA